MQEPFRIDVISSQDGDVVARLFGELDLACQADFETLVLTAIETFAKPHMVVDLRGLTFCDSFGIGLLLRAAKQAQERGGTLELIAASERVHRVFEIAGVDKHLDFVNADRYSDPTDREALA